MGVAMARASPRLPSRPSGRSPPRISSSGNRDAAHALFPGGGAVSISFHTARKQCPMLRSRQLPLCSTASQCRASAPLVLSYRAYKSPAVLVSKISSVQKVLKKLKPQIGQDAELAVGTLELGKAQAIYLHEAAQREKEKAVSTVKQEKAEAFSTVQRERADALGEQAKKNSKLHEVDVHRRYYATQLLKSEGKLNMRGLLEFSMATITDLTNQSLRGELRKLKGSAFWEKALAAKEYHGLLSDIAQRTGWAPAQVPQHMAALYERLSEQKHENGFQRSVLELVVGEQATQQECVAMEALADHLGVSTEIVEWWK